MSELLRNQIVNVYGESIDVDASTGQELIEAGRRLRYPFLVIRGQEKQVVEGVEQMLTGLNQPNKAEEQ